jgi:hypothetical protein
VSALKLAVTLPHEYFRCSTYACDLKKTACVARQSAGSVAHGATITRNGVKRRSWKWSPPWLIWCSSGKCEQGAKIRASLPEQPAIRIKRSGK